MLDHVVKLELSRIQTGTNYHVWKLLSTLKQKTKTDNEPVLSPADKRERCSQVPAVKCEPAGPPQTQCRTVPRQGLNIRNQIYYKIYIFLTTNLNLRKPLPLQNEMQKMNFKTNNRPQMLSFFFYFSCCSWKCEIEPLYEGSSAGWSTNKNAGKSIQSPQFFRSNLNFLPCKIIVDRSKSLTGHFLDQSSEDLNCPDLDCKDTSAPFLTHRIVHVFPNAF